MAVLSDRMRHAASRPVRSETPGLGGSGQGMSLVVFVFRLDLFQLFGGEGPQRELT